MLELVLAAGAALVVRELDDLVLAAFGGRRNQYASTGTIVSATSSDESSAIVTVSANGRNSSPVTSPTNAIGRNTATVVMVDAVTAPATSRTARTMVAALVHAVRPGAA